MSGTLVLQGGGPFVANDDLDRRVLAERGIDRVVVLPTADAFEQPTEMVASAVAWGERLAVAVEPLMVLTRSDVTDAVIESVAAARAVVLAGDSASHLRSVLKGSALFDALNGVLERDGVLIAVAASAAALCDPMVDERGGGFALGLGLVADLAVVTGVELWPAAQIERTRGLATTPIAELPTGSALVRTTAGWETVGDVAIHGDLPPIV